MNTLVYDTETSGLPAFSDPSDAPHQPHLVEVAAVVVDAHFEIVHSLSLIVRPDDWEIPDETAAIHGITTERARAVGIAECDAVAAFMALWRACELRVGFNESFDARILRIALKRHLPAWAEPFKEAPRECAMRMSQKLLGGKWPKLDTAFEAVVGRPRQAGAHSAYQDTVDTALLYRHLSERLACSSAT